MVAFSVAMLATSQEHLRGIEQLLKDRVVATTAFRSARFPGRRMDDRGGRFPGLRLRRL
jgi:hypothetical protein